MLLLVLLILSEKTLCFEKRNIAYGNDRETTNIYKSFFGRLYSIITVLIFSHTNYKKSFHSLF